MRILLANYRYFLSGGSERYLFNVSKLLESHQHQVVPFSVSHPRNQPSIFSPYFLSPLSQDRSEIYFRQLAKHPANMMKFFGRTFYSFEARRQAQKLLEHMQVDVAYVLHFLRWISPSLLDVLREHRVPVIIRLSDFVWLCPEVHMLRKGQICKLCVNGNYWHSVEHRCVQRSFPISLINALSIFFHRFIRILDKIDAVVCPSEFLYQMMIAAGFVKEKLHHLPTFIDPDRLNPSFEPGDYALYFGRISREKGVEILLDAFAQMKRHHSFTTKKLLIVGSGDTETLYSIQDKARQMGAVDVEFAGEMSGEALFKTIRNSAFVVVPSISYENMPHSVLESYGSGKPVIASNLGSLPEMVEDQRTGYLFEAGNAHDLATKMSILFSDKKRTVALGKAAFEKAKRDYRSEAHFETLMDLFLRVRKNT